jgi:hypothetical protein
MWKKGMGEVVLVGGAPPGRVEMIDSTDQGLVVVEGGAGLC